MRNNNKKEIQDNTMVEDFRILTEAQAIAEISRMFQKAQDNTMVEDCCIIQKVQNDTITDNSSIIKNVIGKDNFYKRIQLPEGCYYYHDGRTNGGNKDNKDFVFSINKTKLNAEIKLGVNIGGGEKGDVMIINDGKNNSIVLQLMNHPLEKITPKHIKDALHCAAVGYGNVKYPKDEGFNGKNANKITVDLQKLFITKEDIANCNKNPSKQRKKGNLSR